MDALALEAIEGVARERGAPIVRAWEDVSVTRVRRPDDGAVSVVGLRTPAHDYGDVTVGLRGAHQVGNAVVAVRVLEMLDRNGSQRAAGGCRAGLSRPEWPGRLDLRRLPDGRELLLDAAHNPAGAAALASYLQAWSNDRLPLVFAAMRDKDADGMLRGAPAGRQPGRVHARLEHALGRSARARGAGAKDPARIGSDDRPIAGLGARRRLAQLAADRRRGIDFFTGRRV